MATAELVTDLKESGRQLTQALDHAGVAVPSSFWYYDSEAAEWRLFLAMPMVDEQGPSKAYDAIQTALKENSIRNLFLRQISVESPKNELVTLVRKALSTGPGIYSIRFSHNVVNNVLIEDASIYRST